MTYADVKPESRIAALRWMADVLERMPNGELLGRLTEMDLEATGIAPEDAGALSTAAESLSDAADGEAVKALRVEHTGLFCGLRPDAPHPYESAYTSGSRLLRQEAESQVRAIYEDAGFPDRRTFAEESDYLPYELRFCAWLLERGESGEADRFAEAHLQNWVGRWSADLGGQCESGFYRAIASCLPALIGNVPLKKLASGNV